MRVATIIVLSALLAGCGSVGGSAPRQTTFTFDFGQGAQGWTTGFSDYPVGQEQFFQLDSGLRTLPPPLDQNSTGILLSGVNHSDDLFMFLTGRLTGFKPDQKYRFNFLVEFATNAPSGCISIGVLQARVWSSKLAQARPNPNPSPWQAVTL
jgi:hypothetical protein